MVDVRQVSDDDDDDDALLDAAAHADQTAVEALVRRHTPAMRRLAQAVLGDAALAEDVVQDSWIAALRGAGSFQGRSSVRSWLLAICANTARTRRGKEQRVLPFSAVWKDERGPAVEIGMFSGSGAWAAPVTVWDDGPHDHAAAAVLRKALEDAIDDLPPRQRAVVVAADVLGCRPAEIAAMMGVTPGHQRVLLHKARVRLRASLDPYRRGQV